jgi:hypothetical protein
VPDVRLRYLKYTGRVLSVHHDGVELVCLPSLLGTIRAMFVAIYYNG